MNSPEEFEDFAHLTLVISAPTLKVGEKRKRYS
jgi:hypothetical protein